MSLSSGLVLDCYRSEFACFLTYWCNVCPCNVSTAMYYVCTSCPVIYRCLQCYLKLPLVTG